MKNSYLVSLFYLSKLNKQVKLAITFDIQLVYLVLIAQFTISVKLNLNA